MSGHSLQDNVVDACQDGFSAELLLRQRLYDEQNLEARPNLLGRRVLVVDGEADIRLIAYVLLEKYGCIVETAHRGDEAVALFQHSRRDQKYDAVLCAVNLPDMTGDELLVRLTRLADQVPLAWMCEFGRDVHHALVKARQEGIQTSATLIKPFVLKQLLKTVESVIDKTA